MPGRPGQLSVVVRRARASDKEPLMKFIRKVWGGHDYIPSVWDEWLADKKSILDVLTVDGLPVGLGRLRYLDDGAGWLEGARVHPEYRGRGLAGVLGGALIKEGGEKGVTTFRLTSSSWNWSAHRQVAKMGFREVSRVSVYEPKKGARFRAQTGVRRAGKKDVPAVEQIAMSSKEYRAGAGVYWDAFTATKLGREQLLKLAGQGSVLVCEGAVAVAKLGGEGNDVWRQVCFAGGRPEGVAKLVAHIFGRREALKTSWKLSFTPQGSPMIASVRGLGLRRSWSLVLFEKSYSKD
jgi:ribosomal protein S18 acetylase RimI-like enzyme